MCMVLFTVFFEELGNCLFCLLIVGIALKVDLGSPMLVPVFVLHNEFVDIGPLHPVPGQEQGVGNIRQGSLP